MGLIKNDGYLVKGVSITPAYAKITRVYLESGNNAKAYFGISSNRENIENNMLLEEIEFTCEINKQQDTIFNEIYTRAKQEIFTEWQDDIPTEENIE